MSEVYQILTPGPPPVTLEEMKTYLKIPPAMTASDDLLNELLDAATAWGEGYTRTAFRANQWALLLDCFTSAIEIRRRPVDTIDSIEYLVDAAPVVVDPATYYLVDKVETGEIHLFEGQEWPDNVDPRLQAITVTFTTKIYQRKADLIRLAIKRLVAYLFVNRGDCLCDEEAAIASGALPILGQFRISRI